MERHKTQALREAEKVSDENLTYRNLDDLVQQIWLKHHLHVPVFNAPIVGTPKPVQLTEDDLRGQRGYFPSGLGGFRGAPQHPTGVEVQVVFPFEGTSELFYCRPSHFTFSPPAADVKTHQKQVVYSHRFLAGQFDPAQFMPQVSSMNNAVLSWLENMKKDVVPFNGHLRALLTTALSQRREQLAATIREAHNLGFQTDFDPNKAARVILQNSGPLQTAVLSSLSSPQRPSFLPDEDYRLVVEALSRMGRQLERSNTIVRKLDEESIRDVLLCLLNAYFPGRASGETFNRTGKTDLQVRQDQDLIFVGECKIWGGPKKFDETIDQLLPYLTSRDLRSALLVFNHNQDVTAVAENAVERMKAHPDFLLETHQNHQERRFDFVFRHPRDRAIKLSVALLVFDLKV